MAPQQPDCMLKDCPCYSAYGRPGSVCFYNKNNTSAQKDLYTPMAAQSLKEFQESLDPKTLCKGQIPYQFERANSKQISGDHYKKYGDLQPWDVVYKWNLGYYDGTALKYIARWRDKGGIDDLKKAIHFLEKLIELQTPTSDTQSK
jgi:Protein of unknwon function (DUF3310)